MSMATEPATAKDAFEITASDTTVIRADAIQVGTGGTINVVTARGTEIDFDLQDGAILPISVVKVKSTGTSGVEKIRGLLY